MAVTGLIPGRWLEAPARLPLPKAPHSPLGGSCGRGPPRALEEWRPGGGGLQARPPVLGQSWTGVQPFTAVLGRGGAAGAAGLDHRPPRGTGREEQAPRSARERGLVPRR